MESLVRAGIPLISTVGAPGTQGATMAGTQGTGTPRAAMTSGLAGELHNPKVAMFSSGTKSMMVATGVGAVTIAPSGMTTSGTGTFPIGHITIAPSTTSWPMLATSRVVRRPAGQTQCKAGSVARIDPAVICPSRPGRSVCWPGRACTNGHGHVAC